MLSTVYSIHHVGYPWHLLCLQCEVSALCRVVGGALAVSAVFLQRAVFTKVWCLRCVVSVVCGVCGVWCLPVPSTGVWCLLQVGPRGLGSDLTFVSPAAQPAAGQCVHPKTGRKNSKQP